MHILNQISISMRIFKIFFLYYKHNFLKIKHETIKQEIKYY